MSVRDTFNDAIDQSWATLELQIQDWLAAGGNHQLLVSWIHRKLRGIDGRFAKVLDGGKRYSGRVGTLAQTDTKA